MEIANAAGLIKHPDFNTSGKINWADLGCGTGTFTLALASLLPKGSAIYAVDSNELALQAIPDSYKEAIIEKVTADFVSDKLAFNDLDGILMANSLHYVKNKPDFIKQIIPHLKKEGCILVVEYDTDIPNNWVPYPLSYSSLQKLFSRLGFTIIRKLNERSSIFNRAMMYAAIIER
jgi:ubiquinone/menaquinone biosynthesis C-methylase UbiE